MPPEESPSKSKHSAVLAAIIGAAATIVAALIITYKWSPPPPVKTAELVPLSGSFRPSGVSFTFQNSGQANSTVGDAKMALTGDNVNQEFSLSTDETRIVKAGETVEISYSLNTPYFDSKVAGHCQALDRCVPNHFSPLDHDLILTTRVEYSPDGRNRKWYEWSSCAKDLYYMIEFTGPRSCNPKKE